MFNDMSRAYMHVRTASEIHVEVCEEDKTEPGNEHRYGKLFKLIFGTRATVVNGSRK